MFTLLVVEMVTRMLMAFLQFWWRASGSHVPKLDSSNCTNWRHESPGKKWEHWHVAVSFSGSSRTWLPYEALLENSSARKNKATGWLGALVRVTILKFWFLRRLRDNMLVLAGVVKKGLQHGHSFRLAGVWLKSESLRFACAVTRFCSSRVTKKNIIIDIFDFQSSESYQGDIRSSSFSRERLREGFF